MLLVTTDGLRWQEVFTGAEAGLLDPKDEGVRKEFWRDTPEERRRALMPFLWGTVAMQGRVWGDRLRGGSAQVSNAKRVSYPGYQEMLCGFADPRIAGNDKKPNPEVTVLEWLNRRPGFKGRVAAFGNWDRLPFILNRERSGLHILAPGEDIRDEPLSPRQSAINDLRRATPARWEEDTYDSFTHYSALEHLRRHKPRVLYILYEETDEWAHEGRYADYLRAARRVDGFLRELWETVQAMPEYRGRTSLIVSTDHGRGSGERWNDHNEGVPGSENIWIAAMGPGVAPRGEVSGGPRAHLSQIAATVAALAGEDYARAVPRAAPPLDLGLLIP